MASDRPGVAGHRLTRGETLFASAVAALVAGTAVYVLARDWAPVLFLAPLADWQPGRLGLFGGLAYTLPAFLHAYAFALLLILALLPSRSARWLGALAWLLLASGLEVLQSGVVKAFVAEHFHAIAGTPVAGAFLGYITFGRFDAADLVATALGVFTAWLTSFALEKQS
jgi:hypothetical protein